MNYRRYPILTYLASTLTFFQVTIAFAEPHLVSLFISCSETSNGKAGAFQDQVFGLISADQKYFSSHWKNSMKSDPSDIYFHDLTGTIDSNTNVARIDGKLSWAKRSNKDKWVFERESVANFKEALSSGGIHGALGQGPWLRKCSIELAKNTKYSSTDPRIQYLETRSSLPKSGGNSGLNDLAKSQEVTTQLRPSTTKQRQSLKSSNINHDGRLVELSFGDAVCNDGSKAKVSVYDNDPKKWAIFMPGGGSAGSADEFVKRSATKHLVSAPKSPSGNNAITRQLLTLGYSVVIIPYCSSDLYQGNHYQLIKGSQIPFKGRAIMESLVKDFDQYFRNAEDLILIGSSAGAVGLGFNLDLFGSYDNTRMILDSFWFDRSTLKWYSEDYPRVRKERVQFQFKNIPSHCEGRFQNCWIRSALLNKWGISEAFIIWNLGDPFQAGVKNRGVLEADIRRDLTKYDGGFSVRVDQTKFNNEKNGHVMVTDPKVYEQDFGGISLSQLVKNWIERKGTSLHIDY